MSDIASIETLISLHLESVQSSFCWITGFSVDSNNKIENYLECEFIVYLANIVLCKFVFQVQRDVFVSNIERKAVTETFVELRISKDKFPRVFLSVHASNFPVIS